MIGYAHAVKIDALAALGELMAQAPKAKGSRGRGPGRGKGGIAVDPPFMDYGSAGSDAVEVLLAAEIDLTADHGRGGIEPIV